jgi:chromosome segregation ATPase
MIIDTNIHIGNSRTAVVHNRPRPTTQNLSGDAMRHHEQIIEYRHRVNALSSDLSSATQALSVANEEIARLNRALAEAQQANKTLQDALNVCNKKGSSKKNKGANDSLGNEESESAPNNNTDNDLGVV